MSEQQKNETTHLFATVSSLTGRGGRVSQVMTKAEYEGKALVRVGDIVTYDGGSEARIIDGAGFAATWDNKPLARVGSHLSNGDTITETVQDGWSISVRGGEFIPACSIRLIPPPTPTQGTKVVVMRKAAVRHGDPTTTGGIVIAYSSTINDHRKKVALSGDEATCGNCKGAWKIYGTGQGMSEKGRVVVLDGDRVLCPCGKNRVIVGSSPGIWLHTSDGSAAVGSLASTSSNSSQATNIYDEQVRASATDLIPEGYPYLIETADGRVRAGSIDASGKLPRIETGTSSDSYSVYWGDEALARQEGI